MVQASVRNGYMLILFLLFAFALNATVMIGNDFIARATDLMLSGESVDFSKFMIPLFWMMGLGTVSAYLKVFLEIITVLWFKEMSVYRWKSI